MLDRIVERKRVRAVSASSDSESEKLVGDTLSGQIPEITRELCLEASGRHYLRALLPDVADDKSLWEIVFAIVEKVLQRDEFVVVKRVRVNESDRHEAVP